MDTDTFKEILAEKMKEVRGQNAPTFNTDDDGKAVFKEFDSYKESLAEMKELDKPMKSTAERHSRFKETVARQYKEAGRLYSYFMNNGINPHTNGIGIPTNEKGLSFETHGSNITMKEMSRIEMKANGGLGVHGSLCGNLEGIFKKSYFRKQMKKRISKQYKWQLKKRAKGLCIICGEKAINSRHCKRHRVDQLRHQRKHYHKSLTFKT